MPVLTYAELEAMPTLHSGHFANLKIDTGTMRVWVSRCTIADGETQPVSVEKLIDGVWTDITGDGQPLSYKTVELDGECTGYAVTCLTRKLG